MATLDEIRAEILETAGLASDDVRFPDASLTRIVNRALRSISSEHDWPWLQATETLTTVSGTQASTPAAAWQKTLRLRYENRDLIEYQPQDAAVFHSDTGSPVGYFIEGDTLNIVPTPDGVYSIHHVYQGAETALSGDSDTPSLPDRFLDWLVFTACIQVAAIIRDETLYAIADRERKEWRKRANDDVRRSPRTLKPKTRNDWYI